MIALMGPRAPDERERGEWEAEFEAAARRRLKTRLRAFLDYWRRTAR